MPIERIGADVRVSPSGAITGTVRPPGSKSLTNRYLACAALADGESVLRGASLSDDVQAMCDGLRGLGIEVTILEGRDALHVHGRKGNLLAEHAAINVGHAGTAMRFLAALTCLGYGEFLLDGSARMRARPIGDLVDALRSLGARIEYELEEGFPPLRVHAQGLAGGEIGFRAPPSSQYISALLMVAPYAKRDVLIRIDGDLPSRPYVDMTCDVMRSMNADLIMSDDARRFVIPAHQRYQPAAYDIEPDASGATYFWSAAAVTGGSVHVAGLTRASRQGDARFVDVLQQMGCLVDESAAGLTVAAPPDGQLRAIDVDLNAMPDTAQTLSVVALFADGPTSIRNVPNLRIKETDRIAALAAELTKLGARVEPRDDGLTIHPPAQVQSATIDTYDDHRMAMSLALAGLAGAAVTIRDADVVTKSVPNFFDLLHGLAG